jgi:hypothetical protein
MRKFPAIRPTLVRPPNPEPYQGSPDAAASGFQRCKKERPIHQDHLLAEYFSPHNKKEEARNQEIFSLRQRRRGSGRNLAVRGRRFILVAGRASGKSRFSVILNGVNDLKHLKIRDYSLRSE